MVLVQIGSEMVLGNMGLPRSETNWSHVFGKIPDWDQDHGVWSSPDQVPVGQGLNFPNTISNNIAMNTVSTVLVYPLVSLPVSLLLLVTCPPTCN